MARSLQSRGLEELASLKKRVNRQHSLERISRQDRDILVAYIDDVEAKIIGMDEKQERDGGLIW